MTRLETTVFVSKTVERKVSLRGNETENVERFT